MQYRYGIIAIAILIVCVSCVSALTMSTSTVRTSDGETQEITTSGGYSSSGETDLDGNVPDTDSIEMAAVTAMEGEEDGVETEEVETEEDTLSTNCTGSSGNEIIIRFEPEYFERSDGTLNELAMEEAELEAHSEIQATVLSDLTEQGMPGLQLVRLPDDMSLEEGIAYYESLPEVRFAEPNYQISIYSDECTEDDTTITVAETPTPEIVTNTYSF